MKLGRRSRGVMDPPIVAFKNRLRDLLARAETIDLSQAVPSYPPPEPVVEALAKAARAESEAHRYTLDPGLPECREAVAAYLRRRHGARVTAQNILLTPGANAAFHLATHVLVDEGDEVGLVCPWYFNHAMSVELLGGRPLALAPAAAEKLWEPSSDSEEGGASSIAGRLVVVVNPSNPTGRALGRREIRGLLTGARAGGGGRVLDETYLEFFPKGEASCSLLAEEGWEESAVVVGTFSKSLAVSGYRIGYLCAAPEVIREVLKVHDTAVVCAPRPAQLAVMAGLEWRGLDAWLEARRGETEERVRAFTEAVQSAGGPFRVESAGAFFAYLRCGAAFGEACRQRWPEIPGEWAVAHHLAREAGVVTLPGAAFGPGQEDALRTAVGNAPPALLREAAERMAEC